MLKYKKNNKKFLTREEEIALFERYQANKTDKLKNEILENYSALVYYYSKKMCHKKHQYDDVVQEGFLGLSIAIDKFNLSNDCRFVHYCGFWIKAQIYNYVFDNLTSVKVPASPAFMKGFWKINKFSTLTNEELSKKFNLSLEQIQTIKVIKNNPETSLNTTLKRQGEDRPDIKDYYMDKVSLQKTSENISITSFEEGFIDREENVNKLNKINNELKNLKPQEQDVLMQYYMQEKTFDEIGKTYNVTRQRIEQIQKTALRKLKENLGETEWLQS